MLKSNYKNPSIKVHTKNYVMQKKLVGAFIITSLISANAIAGAWISKEGSGYGKLSVTNYTANEFHGEDANFGEFKGLNTAYYGEYGLGNNWGLFGQVLHQHLEQTNAAGARSTSSGLGDAELGFRRQFTTASAVYAVSFLTKLPYFYDEKDTFARGDGSEDYEMRFLMGKSLYPYGYVGVELGYRLRTSDASDEYRYLVEYGFDISESVYFRTKLDGVLSAQNGTAPRFLEGTNLSITPEYDLGKWELTAGWNFAQNADDKKWGLELTYTDEVYGDNALNGESIQLALTRVF